MWTVLSEDFDCPIGDRDQARHLNLRERVRRARIDG